MNPARLDQHFQYLNRKPKDAYIEVFRSDWNKRHWSLYAYIRAEGYAQDLEHILTETARLNFREGDVYTELIDYNGRVGNFYHYLHERDQYTHQSVLDKTFWEALEGKGDDHFLVLRTCYGASYHDTAGAAREEENYSIYADWNEVLETLNPDLHKALEGSNALSNFDIAGHYNGYPFLTLDDGRVVFTW